MRVLVFDISSDYAHFRQPYSTTSALTYAIPPRTTVLGIVGAILGIDSGGFGKSEHIAELEKASIKIGVRVMRPIEKIRFNMNYSYTKADAATKGVLHIQVPVEMVKNPLYRFYVAADNGIFEKLEKMVTNKESYYTPYLGISEFLAQVKYVGTYKAEAVNEIDKICTVIQILEGTNLLFCDDQKIFRETHAMSMNSQRHVLQYTEVAYEAEGKFLRVDFIDSNSLVVKISTESGKEAVMLR